MTAVPDSSPSHRRASRAWHGALAAVAVTALLAQVVLSWRGGLDPSRPVRLANLVSFFTIQSNVLVAATAISLVRDPDRDGPWWRVLRLASTVGITVTGIVYVALLRGVLPLEGLEVVTDTAFHYLVPAMTVLGWLAFGPRGRTDRRTLLLMLVWPVLWLGYTLVRGALVDWYPYPFIDVLELGYPTALVNALGVTVLLLGVGGAYLALDHVLTRRVATVPADAAA